VPFGGSGATRRVRIASAKTLSDEDHKIMFARRTEFLASTTRFEPRFYHPSLCTGLLNRP